METIGLIGLLGLPLGLALWCLFASAARADEEADALLALLTRTRRKAARATAESKGWESP